MRDQRDQLIPADTLVERSLQMKGEFVGAVGRDQGCDRDQAAMALGQDGTVSDMPEQHFMV
ncbi:MAG TPA: hypothetical protein VIS96_12595 [Terrimicrobiaceae bacterium]